MSKHVVILAGEPSGDFLGGQLAKALKHADPSVILSGLGGPHMKEAGIDSLFPYEELAVMGIAEILPKLPGLLTRIKQTIDYIKAAQPDVVVTIDSPDFSFRVAKALRLTMPNPPKLIHYVAPTVWAWREGRAKKISQFLDGLICLFDFEPPYFEKYGLRSLPVGHPLVESGALEANTARFKDIYGITEGEPCVGVLFGSRKGELNRTGKILRDAVFELSRKIGGNVHIIAPTLPHVKDGVFDLLKDYNGPMHIVTDPAHKWDSFAAMDVAVAVSGTVGLELAAMTVPHVIWYKTSPLTAEILKRVVNVKYAHLANIMADKEVVPEFLQERCEAQAVADKAFGLYQQPEGQVAALKDVRFRIGAGQEKTPSEKAAAFVLSFVPSLRV